ncbi:MAG: response regulator transcription factor [Alphaproteobacteria bacterium]|nr:response regulator transcription factor [Rhodospirillales bacterium]MCW9044765.1 response regulator transcription factor [Alphaproteobacteria bacterium]
MQVVLADDHNLVREALKPMISRVDDEVEIIDAENFQEAAARAAEAENLKLIILDLKMPGMNGFYGLDQMCSKYPNVPVVILSGSVSRGDVVGAMNHGAKGYIPKTIGGAALVNALRLVLSGEPYFPSTIFNKDGGSKGTAEEGVSNPFSTLNGREGEVLTFVIDGLSNKEIARELNIQEITVKKRLSSIFRKLNVSNRTQATKFALQLNWSE